MPTPVEEARRRAYDEGLRPLVPLADGRDLWADHDMVYAITRSGLIVAVMIYDEYVYLRKEMM